MLSYKKKSVEFLFSIKLSAAFPYFCFLKVVLLKKTGISFNLMGFILKLAFL
jgi:hypothetical protein